MIVDGFVLNISGLWFYLTNLRLNVAILFNNVKNFTQLVWFETTLKDSKIAGMFLWSEHQWACSLFRVAAI